MVPEIGSVTTGDLPTYRAIETSLAEHGLIVRGGFHPGPEDGVPPLRDGRRTATVVMVGNAGSALWPHFSASPEAGCLDHPLDQWTRRVLDDIAQGLDATLFLPFDGPPYLPFQRWAQRADTVSSSPLGLLIHPEFGLWHAYRGALAFEDRLELPNGERKASPCDTCDGRPCLTACPVEAFSHDGFSAYICRDHLSTIEGADCMDGGCLARRACPVGQDWHYNEPHTAFHMRWFASPGDGGSACAPADGRVATARRRR